MNKNFYLTTPLYYVNAEPHIGSAYTTIICDAICRFQKFYGNEVYFLTGIDEHGGKIENTAKQKNLEAQIHCDLMSDKFQELWTDLNINYNVFSRTSSEHHKKFVETFFKKVFDNGDIYEGEYKGLYCLACEDFKNERELIDGNLCPIHKTKVQEYSEKNYFFKLSKYTEEIKQFLKNNPDFIQPQYRMSEIENWISEGLRDFPISRRSVNWGVKVPNDPSQTIYVWFDALLGYLSPLVKNPESLDELKDFEGYYHIVGKDILKFHAVYWIAMLMSAGVVLPQKIFGHGFLTKDGQKMGKTTGNTIDPYELNKKFGTDAVRFYFCFNIPFGADGDYSENVFIELVNAYLANRLGNLFSRVLKLFETYLNLEIPNIKLSKNSQIAQMSLNLPEKVKQAMFNLEPHNALKEIFTVIDSLNLIFTERKPWTLLKSEDNNEKEKAIILLVEIMESLRIINNLLMPFMPNLTEKISKIFNTPPLGRWGAQKTWGYLKQGQKLNNTGIVFSRLE